MLCLTCDVVLLMMIEISIRDSRYPDLRTFWVLTNLPVLFPSVLSLSTKRERILGNRGSISQLCMIAVVSTHAPNTP